MKHQRTRENRYHLQAISVLANSIGYREIWEDREERTTGRIDSIGEIGGVPCFIEIKTSVDKSTVLNLESKISGALIGYNARLHHPMVKAMRSVWTDPSIKPIFAIAAFHYASGAVQAIGEMLESRSKRWGFAWQVFLVTEAGDFSVIAQDTEQLTSPRNSSKEIEYVAPRRSDRNPLPEIEFFRDKAVKTGSLHLMDYAYRLAANLKLKRERRQKFVTLMYLRNARIRVYADAEMSHSSYLILGVPERFTATMNERGFDRHPDDGDFDWPRFMLRSLKDIERFMSAALEAD